MYQWLVYYIYLNISYVILLSNREKMAVLLYQKVRLVLLYSSDSLMNPSQTLSPFILFEIVSLLTAWVSLVYCCP